jgi:hypothetical protein
MHAVRILGDSEDNIIITRLEVVAFGYQKFALIGFSSGLAEPLVEIIRVKTDKISNRPAF